MRAERSPARPRRPPPRALRRDMSNDRDAFRRVVIDRVAPAADPVSAFLVECAARYRAPFSPRSRRLVCQHVGAESSSTSAVSPTCLAAPRASRRAMRRTDFCLLTFFVRAPAPRRFLDASCACAPARSGRSPGSHQCDSLRWATRLSWFHRGGRCLPVAMRVVRTSGIPVASPTCVMSLARPAHPWKPPRPPSARSRERCEPCERSEMPSVEQEPLPRNALSSARLRTSPASRLGHRDSGSRRLFTPASPCGPSRAGLPSTRPVANGEHASLSLGDACRLLQPVTTRGHTLRAFDPRTRVELSPRYSPAPTDAGCVGPRYVAASGACEPRPARAGLRTTCSTCVDGANRGPKRSRKGEPRALGRCRACPSRGASGTRVAGSIGDEVWRTSSLVAPA